MKKNGLPRSERLKGEQAFQDLFAKGKTFNSPLLRVTWMCLPVTLQVKPGVKAAFVVPKRNFKKAADRNRIRRRMKEAYRLHKNLLGESVADAGIHLVFACIYTGRAEVPYAETESKIIVTLQRLAREAFGVPGPPAAR